LISTLDRDTKINLVNDIIHANDEPKYEEVRPLQIMSIKKKEQEEKKSNKMSSHKFFTGDPGLLSLDDIEN
jgi:hypothetical protein